MTHRLTTNYAKNYCNRTRIVKVIVENVVTCFFGHGVDWKDECCQLNLAHRRRNKKYKKRKTNTNKHQCPLSAVQVQDLRRQSKLNQKDYGGKNLWNRRVLALEQWHRYNY